MHLFFGMLFSGGRRSFSHVFGCGASDEPIGTLRRMSGSRPSSLRVISTFKLAELALLSRVSSLLAEPSRCVESHTFFFFFNNPLRSPVRCTKPVQVFTLSAVCYDAAVCYDVAATTAAAATLLWDSHGRFFVCVCALPFV